MSHILWYRQPASCWEQATPLGNGRLGAMVYGRVSEEIMQLNDVTLWYGKTVTDKDTEDHTQILADIRRMIREGEIDRAQRMIVKEMGRQREDYDCSYCTMGNLYVRMPEGEVSEYRRSLSLDDAVLNVSYMQNGIRYEREQFISAPAQTIVVRYTASKPNAITMELSMEREFSETKAENGELVMRGESTPDKGPVTFEVRLRAAVRDGVLHTDTERNVLVIENASEVILFCAAGTNYIHDGSRDYRREDPAAMVQLTLDALYPEYAVLKNEHLADYHSFFDRFSLEFEGLRNEHLPTDERMQAFNAGAEDVGLLETYYQFSRYLLICSSRPDNMLPANLQGIWCREMTPPWRSDYHCDINVQMIYWSAPSVGLADCTEPFTRLIEGLVENGRYTAKQYYGAKGWTSTLMTNAFGFTSPWFCAQCGQYPMGGPWLCTQLYDIYTYTQDPVYRDRIYPVLKESCEFVISFLIEDKDGYLVTSPSISPENAFKSENGIHTWVCEGSTADMEIAYELFSDMIALTVECGKDKGFRKLLEETKARLRPMRIGHEGQLQEWGEDVDMQAADIHHRHTSHLYALYPASMLTPEVSPELAMAAKRSLDIRGDDGTGWALAWKICFRARLMDGEHAYKHVKRILQYVPDWDGKFNMNNGGGTYPNLFDAHPPFQIDGNFGVAAGINEMLVQSHVLSKENAYILNFLPALPKALSDGSIRGIRIRGGFTLDFSWKDSRVSYASVLSDAGKPCALRGAFTVLSDGKPLDVRYEDGVTMFATEKGRKYEIYPA